MIVRFTIPSGTLSLTRDRIIHLDNGVSIQNTMPKRVTKFGDGYSLSIPIGPRRRVISASFSGRDIEEINLIESYFALLGAAVVPNFYIVSDGSSELVKVNVSKYSKSFMNGYLYSLSTEFNEVFRGT
ncbi:hypothetical protein EBZ38_01800 [bacterium]|nr:hypothetical protein [bacterium]